MRIQLIVIHCGVSYRLPKNFEKLLGTLTIETMYSLLLNKHCK